MEDRAIIIMQTTDGKSRDLDVPLNITATELIGALNVAYSLGIRADRLPEAYIKAENPIALIRGDKLLSAYGVHNGTKLRMIT